MKTPQHSRSRQVPVKPTRTQKPSGKRVDAYGRTPARVNKRPSAKKPRWRKFLTTLGAIAALMTGGGIIIAGIWLAILLMVNPNAVIWLNQFLPEWTRIPIATNSPPQTLTAIQDQVRKNGFIPGEPLPLKNSELLLPILASVPNCQTNCEQIVELRVYHPTQLHSDPKFYQLASQLAIAGPEEFFVLSSLAGTKSGNAGVSRNLPLTQLSSLDDKAPEAGVWFNLSGQQNTGDSSTSYGKVVHYNPDQMHLSIMVQWTSPNQVQPYWQQVTGTSTPELVVERTEGLEPRFQVYQIQPRQFVPDPIYLQEINLVQPAIDTQTYRNAMILARSGLWSPARQLLLSQKKIEWSAAAQAQLDVIQLHAQVTAAQARQSWATPSQQILANLIDGRWADALLVFRATESGAPMQEIVTLLKTDSGGLWQRVEAALKVTPKDKNVKAWGALLLAAQQGRAKAIAWLKQLQKTQPEQTKPEKDSLINDLLNRLESASAETSLTSSHASKIVGAAQLVTNVNPNDWLQTEDRDWGTEQDIPPSPSLPAPEKSPTPKVSRTKAQPLQKEAQQVWYQVQVTTFNDGQRWQQTPFSKLKLPKVPKAEQLWKYLGLDSDRQIQIADWAADGSQASTVATVKAVSYRGGVIQLLAAGDPLPVAPSAANGAVRNRPLAYTDAALNWVEPGSITLSDLNQVQPKWVSVLLPTLWRELLKSGQLKQGAVPSLSAMLADMGHWSVRLVELTGNSEPDAVLTVYEDLSGALKKPDDRPPDGKPYKPRTLIFSDTGTLIYSEFSQDASTSLTAIADLGDGEPPALVLNGKSNYSLKRWSAQRKRFD